MGIPTPGHVVEASDPARFTYRYRAYLPEGPALGLAVYLPHFGGTIDDWETSLLPERLTSAGVGAVVGLPIAEGTGYLTENDLAALDAMIHDAFQKARCRHPVLVLGGFSAGGVGAMRYGQAAISGSLSGAIRPRAIFAVDPPLDLRRWYRGMAAIVRREPASPVLGEATYICGMLRELFGGTPDEVPAAFAQASAVSADEPLGGNLRYLRDMAVRLYTEPDVEFWQAHGADLYCLNALDVVYAVTELRAMGNAAAELKVTRDKGYRPDLGGIRLPHAWSIVDEEDLADWVVRHIDETPA